MTWPRLVIQYLDHVRSATLHVGCCTAGLLCGPRPQQRRLKRRSVNQLCLTQAVHSHDNVVLLFAAALAAGQVLASWLAQSNAWHSAGSARLSAVSDRRMLHVLCVGYGQL